MTKDLDNTPQSVRFDDDTKAALKRIARGTNQPQVQLIQIAVREFCLRVEREGELRLKIDATATAGGTNSDFLMEELKSKADKKRRKAGE